MKYLKRVDEIKKYANYDRFGVNKVGSYVYIGTNLFIMVVNDRTLVGLVRTDRNGERMVLTSCERGKFFERNWAERLVKECKDLDYVELCKKIDRWLKDGAATEVWDYPNDDGNILFWRTNDGRALIDLDGKVECAWRYFGKP